MSRQRLKACCFARNTAWALGNAVPGSRACAPPSCPRESPVAVRQHDVIDLEAAHFEKYSAVLRGRHAIDGATGRLRPECLKGQAVAPYLGGPCNGVWSSRYAGQQRGVSLRASGK